MANPFSKRRRRVPGTVWAWWVFLGLLVCTAGWFWILGHDLRIERKKETPSPTTAKTGR